MISEGESNLVLTRIEFELIDNSGDRMFDLLTALKDAVGCGRHGAYWADYAAAMAAGRDMLVEAASTRSVLMEARKYNAQLFPRLSLPVEPGEVENLALRRANAAHSRSTARRRGRGTGNNAAD